MKMIFLVIWTTVLLAGQVLAGEPSLLKTPKDKVNYTIGVSTIRNFKQYGDPGNIDLEMVMKGMRDELSNKKLLLSEKELRSVITAVQTEIMQRKKTTRMFKSMPSATQQAGTGNN